MEVLWLFPLVGLVFVVIGVSVLLQSRRASRAWKRFVAGAEVAQAQVIDLRHRWKDTGESSTGYWVPVVRFALPDGRWVESETMYGAHPAPARTGEVVTVRYDPADPTRVNLADGLAQGSTASCIGVGLGMLFVVLGSLVAVGTGLLALAVHG